RRDTSAVRPRNAPGVPSHSVTASLMTSAPITGTFTVVPSNATRTAWFDAVTCSFPKATPVPSNRFTPKQKAIYTVKTGTGREAVVVPGPGKLIFAHRTIVAGG